MTCDPCLRGSHFRCLARRQAVPCDCSACGGHSRTSSTTPRFTYGEPKVTRLKPRKERVEKVQTARQVARSKYGVTTDFTDEEIEQIFEMKAAGETLSGAARALGTTRDRIRTIYNAPTAPEHRPLGSVPTADLVAELERREKERIHEA